MERFDWSTEERCVLPPRRCVWSSFVPKANSTSLCVARFICGRTPRRVKVNDKAYELLQSIGSRFPEKARLDLMLLDGLPA